MNKLEQLFFLSLIHFGDGMVYFFAVKNTKNDFQIGLKINWHATHGCLEEKLGQHLWSAAALAWGLDQEVVVQSTYLVTLEPAENNLN